jgi:hypothetical protein
MADQDVKIHVSADADLKKIEDAQKKIADLHRAAAAYESNPNIDMSTAAASARSEAKSLERDVARWTKERASAEKAVTQEVKEQGALRKAGIGIPSRGIARAVGVGEQILTGGDPASAASSLLVGAAARSGNPVAIVGAIAAAIATSIIGVNAQQRDKDTAQGLSIREKSFNRAYDRDRAASAFGSSGSLVSSALDSDAQIAQRKAARAGLDEKAREKWYDPSSWTFGGMRKNEGQRDIEKNEAEIADLERQKEKDLTAARKKYMAEEGGLELDALRQRSLRTLAGNRAAFVDEEAGKWMSKYKSALKESGDDKTAKEIADLSVQNDLRDKQAQAGAGLVDARSGGAEIAAAAKWATGSFPGMEEVGKKIEALHSTVMADSQFNKLVKQSK